ncbi:response regulator [Halorientalis salina]|nr:response regulator [Halorientalis salina]
MVTDDAETGETVRVVVVDDNPAVVDLASEYLEHTDGRFSVLTETSAPAAVERLRDCEAGVDCIVSDYQMPEMNGFEFLEAVQETCDDVPFILFTSQGRELFEESPPDGVTELIQKDGRSGLYSELADRVTRAAESEAT